jgi:hypothetical protein
MSNRNDEVVIDATESSENNKNNQSSNKSQKDLIEYILYPFDTAAGLMFKSISPLVINYLAKNGPFLSGSGLTVSLGARPEWKDSQNIIYIPANGQPSTKADITRFVSNNRRLGKNRMELFHSAMKQLIIAVQEWAETLPVDRGSGRITVKVETFKA